MEEMEKSTKYLRQTRKLIREQKKIMKMKFFPKIIRLIIRIKAMWK